MRLREHLKALDKLSVTEIDLALDSFGQEKMSKGDYYLREGQVPEKISFIDSGLFTLFYQVEGHDKVMLFFSENQFMTDYFGYLTQSPSIRPIRALEDSIIYSISRDKLNQLFDRSKNWERIGRILAESAYIKSVQLANRLLHDDHDTRVHTFLQENPGLMQRVPQYLIASYLDMTPETLSRVKKRSMNNKEIKGSIHKKLD